MPEQAPIPAISSLLVSYGATSEGQQLSDGGSMSIGSFVKDTEFSFYLFLIPDDVTPVYLQELKVDGQGYFDKIYDSELGDVWKVSQSTLNIPLDIKIDYPVFAKIIVDTSVAGNKSITVSIITNSEVNPDFKFTFYFTVTVPSTLNPDIAVLHSGNNVSYQGSVALTRYSLESENQVSFQIFNYATPSLTIPQNGISITSIGSNETVISNPSSSADINLAFNQSVTITVGLDTSSVGDKSFVVVIISNDPDENPFIFTVTYNVAKPFELIVLYGSTEITDDVLLNIGSFNQKSIISKIITLENNGIAYGIRVTNILVDGGVSLQNLPALPFILQPNKANTVQFTSKFASESIGKKTGSIKVQWEVEA